ncbi:origin recognition complex subunit 5-like [Tropilaelaps mercedesae]|uniref:Origin recognition complex subunit 5-like n=1 Tax=Tropilaelaps mercedesae TaxID=418985 RepID=A0A1V9XZE3_9ACAR|nr:origin recognition complex subunit 5-like [Tropilaelaps mercedesae]
MCHRSFTPQPGGHEFRPGRDYFLISTSSGRPDGLMQERGGACREHNMRLVLKICCKPPQPSATFADQGSVHGRTESQESGVATAQVGVDPIAENLGSNSSLLETSFTTQPTGQHHRSIYGVGYRYRSGVRDREIDGPVNTEERRHIDSNRRLVPTGQTLLPLEHPKAFKDQRQPRFGASSAFVNLPCPAIKESFTDGGLTGQRKGPFIFSWADERPTLQWTESPHTAGIQCGCLYRL